MNLSVHATSVTATARDVRQNTGGMDVEEKQIQSSCLFVRPCEGRYGLAGSGVLGKVALKGPIGMAWRLSSPEPVESFDFAGLKEG
jgi:hypothetical protein